MKCPLRMLFPRKEPPPERDKEAAEAVASAHEKLEDAKAQRPRVDELTASLQKSIRANEFRLRMEQAFRGR